MIFSRETLRKNICVLNYTHKDFFANIFLSVRFKKEKGIRKFFVCLFLE